MKVFQGKPVRIAAAIVLAALVLVLCIWHKCTRAVWCNLTVSKIELDDSADWDGGTSYTRIPYAEDSDSQYLDLYVPGIAAGETPKLFVIIHGGGFIYGDSQTRQAQFMYRYFRDRGYACATVNYRLAQEEPFPGGVCDCKAAIRFLRAHADEYGYDAEHIAVFGESAGGYLAVMCAVTGDTEFMDVKYIGQDVYGDISARVDVLVDYYGHIDKDCAKQDWKQLGIPEIVVSIANSWADKKSLEGFEDMDSYWHRKNISAMTREELSECDPNYYIEKNDLTGLSAWIIHGDADITVPYLHSERLARKLTEKLGADKVSYELVPGMGHASDPLYAEAVLDRLDAFMKEHL